MSKLMIGLIVAGLVVVGGGAAYLVLSGDDEDTSTSEAASSEESTDTSDESSEASEFAPTSTEGLPVVVTIKTTSNGKTVESVMEYDGETTYRYVANQQGQDMEVITTADASYMKIGDQGWFKYDTKSAPSSFNSADFEVDDDKLAEYKSNSTYKGTESCISGTCDVWEVSSGTSGTSTVYIDTETKRVVEIKTEISGTTSHMTYEYKNVKITPPAKFTTFPTAN